MNVSGDAASFLFEGLPGCKGSNLDLVFASERQKDEGSGYESGEDGEAKFKPPCFPEEGLHGNADRGSTLAPVSGAATGDDLKTIISGWEAGEGHATLIVDDLPFFINGVEAVADEGVFGSGEIEDGEGDHKVVMFGGELDDGSGRAEVAGFSVYFPGEH